MVCSHSIFAESYMYMYVGIMEAGVMLPLSREGYYMYH